MKPARKQPDPIDAHIGGRVGLRRRALGMTQTALAERLGVSFQQVQKYETGKNRIAASKLHRIAGALDVPVTFFFEGLAGQLQPDEQAAAISRVFRKPQAMKILRIAAIMNDEKLAALARCAEAIAGHFAADEKEAA